MSRNDSINLIPNIDYLETLPTPKTYKKGKEANRPTLQDLRQKRDYQVTSIFVQPDQNKEEMDIKAKQNKRRKSVDEEYIDDDDRRRTIHWFGGVYLRCVLNLFNIVLFLRCGILVGYSGLYKMISIIVLSYSITFLTTISMSAMVTNGQIEVGGAYFLTSRELGPEFGGAIGILFYFANIFSGCLNIVGISLQIFILYDFEIISHDGDYLLISYIILFIFLFLSILGRKFFVKLQYIYILFTILGLSSFFIGTFLNPTDQTKQYGFHGYHNITDNLESDWKGMSNISVDDPFIGKFTETSYIQAVAWFFPAATGIMTGPNFSGCLKNPSETLPKGSFLSIITCFIVYFLVCMILSFTCNRVSFGSDGKVYGLLYDTFIFAHISAVPWLSYLATFATALATAHNNLEGAPRLLQAMGKDRLFWLLHYFEKVNKNNVPILAHIVTTIIGMIIIPFSNINILSSFVSITLLTVYAITNFACFSASFSKSPGWRPSFKYYNQYLSLLASIGCIVVILLINFVIGIIVLLVAGAVYLILKRLGTHSQEFGTSSEGYKYRLAKSAIENVANISASNIKVYRPQYLIVCDPTVEESLNILYFIRALRKGNGIVVVGEVHIGSVRDLYFPEIHTSTRLEINKRNILEHRKKKILQQNRIKAVYVPVAAKSMREGSLSLLQSSGYPNIRPNTLVLKFLEDLPDLLKINSDIVENYFGMIEDAFDLYCCVMLIRGSNHFACLKNSYSKMLPNSKCTINQSNSVDESNAITSDTELDLDEDEISPVSPNVYIVQKTSYIDIWWLADDGGFTVLIPYILTLSKEYQHSRLRIKLLVAHQKSIKQIGQMNNLLKKLRIDAEVSPVEYVPKKHHCNISSFFRTDSTNSKESSGNEDNDGDTKKDSGSETEGKKPPESCYHKYKWIWESYKRIDEYEHEIQKKIDIGEVIASESKDAALVFISMTIPKIQQDPALYLILLYVLSNIKPPCVLIRGNQTNVITMYN